MELAKVTLRGQITIPAAIRRKLKIREGDKVVFVEKDGRIFVENAAMLALREAQEGFRGETERAGLNSEKDVVTLVREVRKEIREENHAGDA
ncbi:MAG TPA: AbrB/MazE/SpoVT family DNA-binding domain-containing protein [Synergistaceae bacterium]|nr:AbrB/MazE/SpoVT family DNA-binding domain-containing protein [Synergistaceae bacterium]HPJ26251.1 AbrB/MazE/SpoVT family DNA-binding domain-containing protein [Synergistaceae bacterium]HPQ38056.1 AbrB/MazE/SpoVT family DNA-binding domain-containing protein [Synergistaceae bacterium]